jgi:hypothetical protein
VTGSFLLDGSDLAPVIEVMDRLTAAGKGWIDVTPAGMEPPAPTSVWGRINGRGPTVPRLTWTAPQEARRKPEPAAIGIEHPSGPRALARLDAAGHPLPAGWRRLQDHSMRGLVLEPPSDARLGVVFGWSLRAVQILGGIDSTRWTVRVLGDD